MLNPGTTHFDRAQAGLEHQIRHRDIAVALHLHFRRSVANWERSFLASATQGADVAAGIGWSYTFHELPNTSAADTPIEHIQQRENDEVGS